MYCYDFLPSLFVSLSIFATKTFMFYKKKKNFGKKEANLKEYCPYERYDQMNKC